MYIQPTPISDVMEVLLYGVAGCTDPKVDSLDPVPMQQTNSSQFLDLKSHIPQKGARRLNKYTARFGAPTCFFAFSKKSGVAWPVARGITQLLCNAKNSAEGTDQKQPQVSNKNE